MSALPIDLDAFEVAPLTREPFPFLMVPRSFPRLALGRLYDLIQTGAEA